MTTTTQTQVKSAAPNLKGPAKANSLLRDLTSLPTKSELQACWELCRFDSALGFWVVWIPVAWSIAMAYHANPEITAKVALTRAAVYAPLCVGITAIIMTIDDLLDHDVDARVERTKRRAIPRGAISVQRAWIFFGMQAILGVYLANKYLKPETMHISMAVWPVYIAYPTCKRWMYFAPIPLGLMFQIGIFMGWSDLSADGTIPWEILTPMYIGACLWTITYETVYQHLDRKEDIRIGLKSLAIFMGDYTIPICTITGIGFVSLFAYAGALNGQGIPYFIGLAISAMLLLPRLLKTDINSPEDCKNLFLGTGPVGQIILVGLVVDVVLRRVLEGIPL